MADGDRSTSSIVLKQFVLPVLLIFAIAMLLIAKYLTQLTTTHIVHYLRTLF